MRHAQAEETDNILRRERFGYNRPRWPLGVFKTILEGDKDATKSKELLFESIKDVISSKYLSSVEIEG